jgi:methylenetetrahydrofolate dehydrogenase(NAD+) / 5,10-methenyltetrahydrofolate cyclohydrolase
MAKLIDGKQIAADIRGELKEQIIEWTSNGHRAPQLTAILIGEDAASSTYVNNKMKVSSKTGLLQKRNKI